MNSTSVTLLTPRRAHSIVPRDCPFGGERT